MGSLRFILANLVMISHLGYGIGQYHLGVIAVVIFYMLSGRVAMRRWIYFQGSSCTPLKDYYFDRLQRIYPQYLFALVCAFFLWINGVESDFLSKSPQLRDWIANILIIPLNFYMYFDIDKFTLIPPAWSLGAELQFMMVLPILFLTPMYVRIACLMISAGIFLLAQLAVLHTDYWGYRLLPGILFVFYCGALSNQLQAISVSRKKLFLLSIAYLLAVLYGLYLFLESPYIAFRHEVMFGLVMGVPLLILISGIEKKYSKNWQQLDRQLGFLSYGVFLQHFNMMWVTNWGAGDKTWTELALVVFGTLGLAFIGHNAFEKTIKKMTQSRFI